MEEEQKIISNVFDDIKSLNFHFRLNSLFLKPTRLIVLPVLGKSSMVDLAD